MIASIRSDTNTALRRALIAGAAAMALLIAGPTAALAASEGDSYEVSFDGDRSVDGEHTHVVEKGEYLSTIAADYGLDQSGGWQMLFDANESIDNPDVIGVGQEIVIPEEGETLVSRAVPDSSTAESSGSSGGGSNSGSSSGSSSDSSGSSSDSSGSSSESRSESSSASRSSGSSTANAGVWDRLAECESNGNWSINTGNGYYGGLQFDKSSWDWAGGEQYAEYPHQASKSQQIAVAERLREIHPAGWGAWPACSSKLGLR